MSEHRNFDIIIGNDRPVIYTEKYRVDVDDTIVTYHILSVDRLREIIEQGQKVLDELVKANTAKAVKTELSINSSSGL